MKKYRFTLRWWAGSQGKRRSGRPKEGTEDSLEKFGNKGRERVVHKKEARLIAEFCGLGKMCTFIGRRGEAKRE